MGDDPPIPHTALRDLFERLDRTSMTGYQCDHTFALTEAFLRERGLPVEPTVEWLGDNGAGCDCEVMMNTAGEWEEAVGYRPPDADTEPIAAPDPAAKPAEQLSGSFGSRSRGSGMRRWRYLLVALVGVLVAAVVGVGCLVTSTRAVEPSQLRGPYRVEVYQGGQPASERVLSAGSAEEQAVVGWLAAHSDGWLTSLVTYAPSRVVRGDGFNLNLLPDGLCVLNYDLLSSPRQVVRSVSPAEAEALVAAMGGK